VGRAQADAEYKSGLERAIANGWLWLHEAARS